jgi:predicted dehydrogenase
MSSRADGQNYAPEGKAAPVVPPGTFRFAAMHLDHGHITGMCRGLTEAGAEMVAIYDPDPAKVASLQRVFPNARAARSAEEVLEDRQIRLVAAAAVTSERGPLGCRVMRAGKDYFTDKAPLTTLEQLAEARRVQAETGRIFACYYSERLHNEAGVYAGQLVQQGAIGRVLQVLGLGPHRLRPESRPAWFFQREKFGGILCDIGSHQCEQFLYYTGATDAEVVHSAAGNYGHPEYPEFEDFGEANLVADNGAAGYFRVDWFTPDGLSTWGDGRTVLMGTEGYIEMRKYVDVARDPAGNQLYLVNKDGEQHLELEGKVGYPYFGQLVLDSVNRTENAMPQAHTFKAAELCLKAQAKARRLG